MIESIYLIAGVIMGVFITILGAKLGSKTYKDAISDITQPPQFSDEDRTQTTSPTFTSYDYNQYEEHYDTLKDEDKEIN